MKITIAAAVAIFFLLFVFHVFRTWRLRKLIKRILQSLTLFLNETRIFINPFTLSIKVRNYRLSLEKTNHITVMLQEESDGDFKYYTKKKFGTLCLYKMPKISKPGIWVQSLTDGKIEAFSLEKSLRNRPAALLIGGSGSGKTTLIKTLLSEKFAYYFFSPKFDEDVKPSKNTKVFPYDDKMLEIVTDLIKRRYEIPLTCVVIDEIISLAEKKHKPLWEVINQAISICRSSNLRFVLCGQRIDRSSTDLQIGLVDLAILNMKDLALFSRSLGVESPTLNKLKTGEFSLIENGIEKLLTNILPPSAKQINSEVKNQSFEEVSLKGKTQKTAGEKENQESEADNHKEPMSEKSGPIQNNPEYSQIDNKDAEYKGIKKGKSICGKLPYKSSNKGLSDDR